MADSAVSSDDANPLIAELEQALVAARQQQALLKSSLTTVIAFLDRDSGT